jgi:predicted nucleic acid-binding protein
MKVNIKPRRFLHKRVVVDASVLLKFFLGEDDADIVKELLQMCMKGEMALFATSLVVFEVLNTIARSYSDPDDACRAYKEFGKLNIGLIDPSDKYVEQAIHDVSENKNISYYDASYHALARDMDAVFLTADKKYYNAMKKRGGMVLFV